MNSFALSLCYVDCVRIGGVQSRWWRNKTSRRTVIDRRFWHMTSSLPFRRSESVFCLAPANVTSANYNTEDVSVAIRFERRHRLDFYRLLRLSANPSTAKLPSLHDPAPSYILGKLSIFGVKPEETTKSKRPKSLRATETLQDRRRAVVYNETIDAGIPCDHCLPQGGWSGDPSAIRSSYADAVKHFPSCLPATSPWLPEDR